MSKYDDLVRKLKEIFQIDRPELDFGVYRILNSRAGEINDYLDNRLQARVQEALAHAGDANQAQLRKELAEAEKNAQNLGMNADEVPKVKELRQRLAELAGGAADHENAVFSHLLTFFSRYYESGDFVSQRRYKGDTYAIPYAGEEVVLHWANKDQYYTKSGENFANYRFKLTDGRSVHFRLIAADTAKDNRKDNDKERCFVLLEQQTRILTDDEGDEYEEELLPIEEVNGELLLRFEYKPMPKGTKQDDLVNRAVQAVLADEVVKSRWLELAKREPTEKNPQRTLLEMCLAKYVNKNKADYFIHKDLGRFLRGELDFYIKNEVLNLDDVQNAERFADIEKNLRMIQCLRAIALDLITFLAQLEDFQKKLWLKKKFVVSAHYCITLDRIIKDAPELLAVIAANERQWAQWETLGMLEGKKNDLFKQAKTGTVDYLQEHPFLMADTALFDSVFKFKLLAAIDNLDETVDGLLIHGDNFQALGVLQERFRDEVDCIYIDPPYNTAASEILYKNQYKHSSWLSLIQTRIEKAISLLAPHGVIEVAIDDEEFHRLEALLRSVLGEENHIANVAIMHNPKGRDKAHVASSHEYTILFAKYIDRVNVNRLPLSQDEIQEKYPKSDGEIYRELPLRRRGSSPYREDRPYMYFPFLENVSTGVISLIPGEEYKRIYIGKRFDDEYVIGLRRKYEADGYRFILPIREDGSHGRWRWGYETSLSACKEKLFFVRGKDEPTIYVKDYAKDTYLPKSLWFNNRYDASTKGTNILKDIVPNNAFDYPKSIYAVQDLVFMGSSSNGIVCDFFGGSGTTAHAIVQINRERKGSYRKYIVVEQGEYFDTVLKPRIQKVVYSADWKDGKATAPQTGISHTFKVLKIESYEDTLNNLELRRSDAQQSLLDGLSTGAREDYLLRYMLDIESRGSILSVDSFRKPFDCKLKVAVDSAGAFEERSIDLVETFNYLIGLRVKSIDSLRERGIVMVQGTLPTGEKTLVLWRECEQVDYEALNRFCDRHAINPKDSEFEVVYINGDHNIPAVLTTTAEEGGITRTLKIRQIEPEFLSRMFEGEV